MCVWCWFPRASGGKADKLQGKATPEAGGPKKKVATPGTAGYTASGTPGKRQERFAAGAGHIASTPTTKVSLLGTMQGEDCCLLESPFHIVHF